MNVIETLIKAYEFNRGRTLALLDTVAQEPDPQRVLAWRPGTGRAPLAWQILHIAITEELFATSRLAPSKQPQFADLLARYQGGSTPDDDIPSLDTIRAILAESRAHLLDTLRDFTDDDLSSYPEALKARGWTLHDALNVLAWHEPHHQGQAHLTFNLWKSQGHSP
jgi:uncharacterized damage-inducible protein DinB